MKFSGWNISFIAISKQKERKRIISWQIIYIIVIKMEQFNQVAQNMVNILSEWKVENDKYKQSIDQLQTDLDAQVASLQNLITSKSATQANAIKTEQTSGKRPLPQLASENEAAAPSKRVKSNEGKALDARKLLADFNLLRVFKKMTTNYIRLILPFVNVKSDTHSGCKTVPKTVR